MPIIKVNCAACGAPISIPPEADLEFITCSSCGTALQVEHGEGYISLKIAEKIAQSIEESGHATRKVIQENSQLTRLELQRIQLAQELSAAEMRLTNIQTEIRMLNRGTGTPTVYAQLQQLYRNEYQVMERVRGIKQQMQDPERDRISTRLEAVKWELCWIPLEMAALAHGNHPQRLALCASLEKRKKELRSQEHWLKVQGMRNNFPSFKVENPPLDDQEQLLTCLNLISQDIKKLQPYQVTPEGATLYAEIYQRYKMLMEAWQKLEGKRLGEYLVSPGYQVDFRSLASSTEYYHRLQKDLKTLAQMPGNQVAREYHARLAKESEKTLKLIRALQKK